MSWLLKGVFESVAEMRRGMQLSRTAAGVLHASAALPLEVGDAFVLEVKLTGTGFQRWVHGVVRARGTGVLTLQVPEARRLLRRVSEMAVLARRSPRFWAGLDVQLSGPDLPPSAGVLLELSADGARVRGEPGAAGREVDISLSIAGALVPLARARICWRTPQHAGLGLVERPAGGVALSRLLRILSTRWSEALPFLAPGAKAPASFPARPLSLETVLARELSSERRPQVVDGGDEKQLIGFHFDRLVPEI